MSVGLTDNSFLHRGLKTNSQQGLVRIEHVMLVKIWRQEQNERCEKQRHFFTFYFVSGRENAAKLRNIDRKSISSFA